MNKHKILLVDDDERVKSELKGLLEDWDFLVETASNGLEAFERIKIIDYDLHVADIRMPHMDGLELIKEVKQLKPTAYFIMFTGHGDEQTAIECLNQGAFHYLKKPVDSAELKIAVERCLGFQKLVDNIKRLEGVMLTARNIEDQIINPAACIVMLAELIHERYKYDEELKQRALEIKTEANRIITHIKQIIRVKELKVHHTVFGPMLDVFHRNYSEEEKE